MSTKFRQHYWNPLTPHIDPVTEECFVHTYSETQEEGTWNGKHTHKTYGELVNVTDGIMVVCSKNGSFYAQANRAVWIPAHLEHEWYMPTKTSNRSLFIHNSVLKDREQLDSIHIIEMKPFLRELITLLHETSLDFNDESHKRLGIVLVDSICSAERCIDILPMPQHHRLIELCTELIAQPSQAITLSDWSNELKVSEKTLTRMFIKETGLNFRTWHKNLRMHLAKKDIEGGMQVTEAAYNCGYTSLSAFICAFKNTYGVLPSKINVTE